MKDEQDSRVLYRRFIQLGRWFLVLVCLSAGGFLLFTGKSKGFGFLLLLAGLWLILDNPLVRPEVSGVEEGGLEDLSQTEPVVLGPSDTLDLHTFSPKEVASLIDEFIRQSQKSGFGLVKIIHGKGTGALRRRVQALLAGGPRVLTFYDASRKSGGWGATVVELRPNGEDRDDQSGG